MDPNAMVDLGYVEDGLGNRIGIGLKVNPDRTANLYVSMMDMDSRRSGEFMLLGFQGATELKQIIDHAAATVGRMVASGQITGLARDRW